MGTGSENTNPPWLGALVEQGIEAVVVFDDAFRLQYANQEACDLLGYAIDDLLGIDVLTIIHADDLGRAAANVSGIHRGAQPDPGLLRLLRGDGEWCYYELHPRRVELPAPPDGPGSVTAVSLRDNTMEDAHWLFLAQLASGADFHECVEAFTKGLSSLVDGPMSVTYEVDGTRRVAGELPLELTWPDPFPVGSPWERALLTGEPAMALVDDLEPGLSAMAKGLGLQAVVVVPIRDPAHRSPALIVQGPYEAPMGEILMIALSRRPTDALTIAFERRHAMDRLNDLAMSDPLTGLANRNSFFDVLTRLEQNGARYSICFVDIDRFKEVNDKHGHLVGDEILTVCARRLLHVARQQDVVARLGGDEFAVVYLGVGEDGVADVAERMVDELCKPADIGGFVFDLGASVGVATARDGLSAEEVLAAADAALYEAKRAGRRTWRASETSSVV